MTDIFIDMDGVVADWNGAVASRFGVNPLDMRTLWGDQLYAACGVSATQFWKRLDGPFFRALRPMHERFTNLPTPAALYTALRKVANDSGGVCAFLTSAPLTNAGDIIKAKHDWLREHVAEDLRDVIFCPSERKRLLARPGRVLIDDYARNCKEWDADLGTAFLYDAEALNLCRYDGSPLEHIIKRITHPGAHP